MAFTGKLGTSDSQASLLVPMYGAGGVKRSKALSGTLTSVGLLTSARTFVFIQVSVTAYRAIARARAFVSTFRTSI